MHAVWGFCVRCSHGYKAGGCQQLLRFDVDPAVGRDLALHQCLAFQAVRRVLPGTLLLTLLLNLMLRRLLLLLLLMLLLLGLLRRLLLLLLLMLLLLGLLYLLLILL